MADYTSTTSKKTDSYEASSSCPKVEDDDGNERKPVIKMNKKNIKVKIRGEVYSCETDGKETVLDMVLKKIEREKIDQKNTRQMFICQRSSRRHFFVNLGLPTGVLDESVIYECIFKGGRAYNTNEMIREFDVANYDDSWDIKFFYSKIEDKLRKNPMVSKMSNNADILQVPFFNQEESYFEALVRDGRFDIKAKDGNLAIGSCRFKDEEGVNVSLKDRASSSDTCFQFHHRTGDMLISKHVKPLPRPSSSLSLIEQFGQLNIKKEPAEAPPSELAHHRKTLLTQELIGSANAMSRSVSSPEPAESNINAQGVAKHNSSAQAQNQSSSLRGSASAKKLVLPALEELKNLIQSHFELNFLKESSNAKEKERLKQIEKVFKTQNYDNFALAHNHEFSVNDLEKCLQLCHSTGAIVAKLINGEEIVKGTCFRVGPKYIITNLHVYNHVWNTSQFTQKVYVDFSYTSKEGISPSSFDISKPIIKCKSQDLDYIIVEVEAINDIQLPKSVTSFFKVSLSVERAEAGELLTLTGHPDGSSQTVTNLMCPVENPDTLDGRVVIGLLRKYPQQQLSDQRRQSYHTSTFFHGSSGSPGVSLRYGFLLILHTRGFSLDDVKGSVIEQGVLMSAIVADVRDQLGDELAEEIFDLVEKMEID